MNKGEALVLETHGSEMIVLSEDGDYLRVRNHRDIQIGDIVSIEELTLLNYKGANLRKITTIAAALLLCLTLASWYYMLPVQAAAIAIDINPSLEIYFNNLGEVISVSSLNEDAVQLLSENDLRGYSLEEALQHIFELSLEKGYLDKTSNVIFTSIINTSKWQQHLKHSKFKLNDSLVETTVASSLRNLDIGATLVVQEVSEDEQKQAKNMGLSVNKFITKKDTINEKQFEAMLGRLENRGSKMEAKKLLPSRSKVIQLGKKKNRGSKHQKSSDLDTKLKKEKGKERNLSPLQQEQQVSPGNSSRGEGKEPSQKQDQKSKGSITDNRKSPSGD